MRAYKVHRKDTATHSLLQDRHKDMLLLGKPSARSLPRGRLMLNNTYLNNLILGSRMWQRAQGKHKEIACVEALANKLKHHLELDFSFLAAHCSC